MKETLEPDEVAESLKEMFGMNKESEKEIEEKKKIQWIRYNYPGLFPNKK